MKAGVVTLSIFIFSKFSNADGSDFVPEELPRSAGDKSVPNVQICNLVIYSLLMARAFDILRVEKLVGDSVDYG